MQEHLTKCTVYQKAIAAKISGPTVSLLGEVGNQHVNVTKQNTQREIPFPRFTSQEKLEVNVKAATWCFKHNLPFTMFDNEDAKEFLQSLNLAYKPLS